MSVGPCMRSDQSKICSQAYLQPTWLLLPCPWPPSSNSSNTQIPNAHSSSLPASPLPAEFPRKDPTHTAQPAPLRSAQPAPDTGLCRMSSRDAGCIYPASTNTHRGGWKPCPRRPSTQMRPEPPSACRHAPMLRGLPNAGSSQESFGLCQKLALQSK